MIKALNIIRANSHLRARSAYAKACYVAGIFLCVCLACCGAPGPGASNEPLEPAADWQVHSARAALGESDVAVKGQALERLAFDGGTNVGFTNASPVGKTPALFSAPELAHDLIKLIDQPPELTASVLNALSALELKEAQLKEVAKKADPTPIIRPDSSQALTSDAMSRDIYLAALRVLVAHGEGARPFANNLLSILEQKQVPGTKGVKEPVPPRIQAEWDTYRADAAQTLLAIGGYSDRDLETVTTLWAKTSSREHMLQLKDKPHERLVNPCALAAANPGKLASDFAKYIKHEMDSPERQITFLLVDSLIGLGCTRTPNPEHHQLVASAFNSKSYAPAFNSKSYAPVPLPPNGNENERLTKFWRGFRPESVKSAAAAALLRMEVAGKQGMPTIKEALTGIDENIDQSSLPGYVWLEDSSLSFRQDLKGAALEMLGESGEHLREVAARVLADLWLAGDRDTTGESTAKLLEAARAYGDTESLRSLLLIDLTGRAPASLKEEVQGLFKIALNGSDEAKRKHAVKALVNLHLKDEALHVRRGITYIPVLINESYAKELVPILSRVFQGVITTSTTTKPSIAGENASLTLRSLGYMRRDAAASLQTIVASTVPTILTSHVFEPTWVETEALNAAAKSGPFGLDGICHLLEMSLQDPSIDVSARAASYYVSGGSTTATSLIALLSKKQADNKKELRADDAKKKLEAVLAALNTCSDSTNLRNTIGQKSIELAESAGRGNEPLIQEIAEKLEDTPFADEIIKAGGVKKRADNLWYFIIPGTVGLGVFLFIMITRWRLQAKHSLWGLTSRASRQQRKAGMPEGSTDMNSQNARPIEVFFSYAHEDEELKDKLSNHLAILQRLGIITGWHDRMIGAGDEWSKEIEQHLNSAQIILLLISADFMASDFCYSVEMTRAVERHDRGEAQVIPLILRACHWQGAPFSKLQALPKNGRPVTSWPNIDEAFTNIAKGIEDAATRLRAANP